METNSTNTVWIEVEENGSALTRSLISKQNLIKTEDLEKQLISAKSGDGGASVSSTSLNLMNAVSGIGVLSMPYALAQGGWLSIILFLAVGLICYYTGILIKRCMRADQNIYSYPDIGWYAFGPAGQKIIALFMYVELYLVAISFLILEGDNLDKIFPGTSVEFSFVKLEGQKLFIVLAAGIILPTTWFKNLSVLAYVSAVGLVASVVLTGSLIWASMAVTEFKGLTADIWNSKGLPMALGLYFVCFSGHAVFPTIYTSMRNKSQFSKVLFISTILCTLNYGLTAVLGYLIYGNDIQSQVTLNLPSEKIYSKIAIYTTLINPLAKYALLITPVTTSIEEILCLANKRYSKSASLLLRTLVLISTVILASYVPIFGSLMSFIGSFLSVMATVLFPCVCYLKIYESARVFSLELVAILVILLIGVLVAVMGTYSSLQQIISNL